MPLPINIKELIHGRTVEWERIEFKEGWNPVNTLHTICAFANDINNWGGGYIIIGIKEKNGRPVLPPKGIPLSQLDTIQKELLNLCNRIRLPYFPKVAPMDFQDTTILVIWVPTGPARPYEAPETVLKGAPYYSYIRRFSSTVKANSEERKELLGLSNRIPFDDQTNHNADLTDLNTTLIKQFLKEIKSALLEEADKMPFSELCRSMNIADGPDEYLKPKNVGLLFFSSNPQKYFPSARIEIVEFPDEDGTDFTEKVFAGPLIDLLRSSLQYIKNVHIKEKIHKVEERAEAERWFNYPYSAIEESLVNAVYHRSYQENEPVEVRVYPSRIEIISYPGPMPPLNNKNIGNISCRRYRNSRIGDFLKELHLTEGKNTGIPKIRKALKNNGSPEARFETDDERSYFITTIYVHPEFKKSSITHFFVKMKAPDHYAADRIKNGAGDRIKYGEKNSFSVGVNVGVNVGVKLNETQNKILSLIMANKDITRHQLSEKIGISIRTVERNIAGLKEKGLLTRIGSDKKGFWQVLTAGT